MARFDAKGNAMHVLIIDDHPLFRQGLRFLLSDLAQGIDFTEAGGVEEAIAQAGREVDVVLLDLHLRGASGGAALAAALAAFAAPVVVLSSEDDPHRVRAAIDGGAVGFVPKASSPPVLIAALRLVLAGGIYLPPQVLEPAPAAQPPWQEGLSGRQLDVLLRAVQGKSNKVIARELAVSEGTVKAHLSAAFRILGVQNRTEAVYAAARLGIGARSATAH